MYINVDVLCFHHFVPACDIFAPQTNAPGAPGAGGAADTDPAGLKAFGDPTVRSPCGGACQTSGLETGDRGGDASRVGEAERNAKTWGTQGPAGPATGPPWPPWPPPRPSGSGVWGVRPGELDLDHAGDGIWGAMPETMNSNYAHVQHLHPESKSSMSFKYVQIWFASPSALTLRESIGIAWNINQF